LPYSYSRRRGGRGQPLAPQTALLGRAPQPSGDHKRLLLQPASQPPQSLGDEARLWTPLICVLPRQARTACSSRRCTTTLRFSNTFFRQQRAAQRSRPGGMGARAAAWVLSWDPCLCPAATPRFMPKS